MARKRESTTEAKPPEAAAAAGDEAQAPSIEELDATFGMFVSAMPGHQVARYGSGVGSDARGLGGAVAKCIGEVGRNPDDKVGLPIAMFADSAGEERVDGRGAGRRMIDHEAIIGLTHDECRLYGREYARALRDGGIRRRSTAEYREYLGAHLVAEAEARKAAAEAAKAKAPAHDATAGMAATPAQAGAVGPGESG